MSASRPRLPRASTAAQRTTRSRLRGVAARLGVAATMLAACTLATVSAGAPASAATTLTVNASQSYRTVTHVASGALYGLDTATIPADSLVEPLHPKIGRAHV